MIKKYDKYMIETKNDTLVVDFFPTKKNKTYFWFTLFHIIFVTLLSWFVIIYYYHAINKEVLYGFILFEFFWTIFGLFIIHNVTWNILASKKLELTPFNLLHTQTLSKKKKFTQYIWKDVKQFIPISNKQGQHFLTIETSKSKKKQLSNGMDEMEMQRLLFKLNEFRDRFQ